jgi:hypothetical protein
MSKRTAYTADASMILNNAGLLEHVFSFLPACNWLHHGGVCSVWMKLCRQLESCEVSFVDVESRRVKTVTCDWRTTLASAVFQSPSRLRLARECGLRLTGYGIKQLEFTAGLYADVPSLMLAEALGLTLSTALVNGTAASGHGDVFEYLTQEQHCAVPSSAANCAARSGNMGVLKCLAKDKYEFNGRTYNEATSNGHLPALQFLLSLVNCSCEQMRNDRCRRCVWASSSGMRCAVESGCVAIVQWLQQLPGLRALRANDMSAAARLGHTSLCEYLHSQGWPFSHLASHAAAGMLQHCNGCLSMAVLGIL